MCNLGLGGAFMFMAKLLPVDMGLQQVWDQGYRHVIYQSDCLAMVQVLHMGVATKTFW